MADVHDIVGSDDPRVDRDFELLVFSFMPKHEKDEYVKTHPHVRELWIKRFGKEP